MSYRTPVELALAYFEAQNQRDLDAIDAVLSPDFKAHTPWGLKTRSEALKAWGAWMAAMPPSRLTVRNVLEAAHGVLIIEITMHFEPGPDDPRGELHVDTCDIMHIEGGYILGLRAYFDRTAVDNYIAQGRK